MSSLVLLLKFCFISILVSIVQLEAILKDIRIEKYSNEFKVYVSRGQKNITLIELTYGSKIEVLPINGENYLYEDKEYNLEAGDLLKFKLFVKSSEREFTETTVFLMISEGSPPRIWSVEPLHINLETIKHLQMVSAEDRPYYYDYLVKYFTQKSILKVKQKKSSAISVMANCPNGQSTTSYNHNTRPCKGEQIFEENFDSLDFIKWQSVIELASDEYDADFVSFQNNSKNGYVKEGILNIVPTLLRDSRELLNVKSRSLDLSSACTANEDRLRMCRRTASGFTILPPVVSAKIQTRNFFSFKYGRVVVRAKVPKGDWIFPLIALDPTTFKYGTRSYQSGQIRVALVRGNEQLTLNNEEIGGEVLYAGPIISPGENNRTILRNKKGNEHFSAKFHDYEVLWTPKYLKFFVDNEQYGEILPNDINFERCREEGAMAPFDQEFHLTLGLSVGGLADFPDGSLTGPTKKKKPWMNDDPKQECDFWKKRDEWLTTWDYSSRLQIDYVKVFALD